MKTHGLKAPVSFLLLLLVLAAFCFNNFAVFGASENSKAVAVDNLPAFEESTGTLTVKGHVLLNGQYVRTGVTVVNGSVIQTDTGAHALIEAGPLGRVDLDPITAILLTYGDRSVQASLNKCGQGVTLNLKADQSFTGSVGSFKLNVAAGFAVMFVSGFLLFWAEAAKKYSNPAFRVKLILLALRLESHECRSR